MDDYRPLAEILRPKKLDDIVGQVHLVGPDGVLRKLVSTGFLPSMVFWGPPGSGKTTLAILLARLTNSCFENKSAVSTTVADVRTIVKEAGQRLTLNGQRTILFIDELHRFTKAQQDAFLPHVENGTVIFIGATTENPSFEVIAPLLSRCRVFVLKRLEDAELDLIIDRGIQYVHMTIDKEARHVLKEFSNADARTCLSILEIAATLMSSMPSGTPAAHERNPKSDRLKHITVSLIEEASQKKMLQYDRAGEEHYDTISAYIKSMRAGDVNAALYYLARMIAAGEDALFIARRMVVFASEDVGSPTALVVANAVFAACQQIGYPECQENMASGTLYLTLAQKDRSAYDAYMRALDDVKRLGNLPIPLIIRNAPTKLMKDLGYGKGYETYTKVDLLPDSLKGRKYYTQKK